METRGDYQAGQSAEENATPEKVIPMRRSGFTMFDNAYLDEAMADLSGAAWKCLSFLIRQTCGFQAQHAVLSLSIFSDGIRRADGTLSTKGTGLTRPSVIAALDDLLRANIIQRTDDGKRTSIPSYALRPQEEWNLAALQGTHRRTSKKTLLADDNGKKTLPIQPETSKETCLEGPSSLSSNFTHVNKGEKKESPEKENDANASADAQARSATPRKASSSKRQPKAETPEQKERRIAEAVYVTDLCNRVKAFLNGAKSPKSGEDRAGGHWFYTAGMNDAPANPEQVMALYAAVKRAPFYRGKYLTLQAITAYWPTWQTNPADVKEAIADEQRRAEYARAAANGHKPQPTMQNIPSTIAFEGD